MAISPTNRVRYLLGLSAAFQSTPATLSGGPDMLFSYQMPIAWRQNNGDYLVTNERNSATTNRHIAAVHAVLSMEYHRVGDEKHPAPWEGTNQTVTRYRPYGKES